MKAKNYHFQNNKIEVFKGNNSDFKKSITKTPDQAFNTWKMGKKSGVSLSGNLI